MKPLKHFLSVSIILLSLYGCNPRSILGFPVSFEENQILFKYDSLEGGVQNKINISGYYSCGVIRDLWWNVSAPFYTKGPEDFSLIFFDDGTFSWLEWKEAQPIFLGLDNLNLSEHLKLRYPLPAAGTIKDLSQKYELCGGIYQTKGDTIITEYVSVDYYSRDLSRTGFVVIDRNTIRMIFHERVDKEPRYHRINDFSNRHETDYLFHFHPATNLPSPVNTYDKHQIYRWNDEEKWKSYDLQRKEYLNGENKLKQKK